MLINKMKITTALYLQVILIPSFKSDGMVSTFSQLGPD